MAGFLTTTFDDAEAAATYLQQKASEAGIEIRITERGYEVADTRPDPARMAAQVRALGITDTALIEQAVLEANSAIADVETFAQDIRKTIPTQGPSVEADAPSVDASANQIGDPFAALVPEWIPYVPSGFSYQGQGTVTGTAAGTPTSNATPLATSTEIMPSILLSLERLSPLGINAQATVMTAVSSIIDTGRESGYHVDPFVSVFDTVSQSSLRA